MSDIAIKVEDLWKQYRIGHKKSASFRESLGQWFSKSEEDYFWALKEIDFEIKRGEAVGIIGKNGAGKSTLLKALSKITYPTKGRIEINGRVSSLLEVGTGFHPELTGRQNVFLNGTILGMTKREIALKFEEIVAFSGVEKFIDTPVKHYSSGMKVRLAFSVAAHLEPEILIIDEVLAVGDAEFQKKCLGKMEDVTGAGRTVLFVSHNMGAVEQLCSRVAVLNTGSVEFMTDDVNSGVSRYLSIDKGENKSLWTNPEVSDNLPFDIESFSVNSLEVRIKGVINEINPSYEFGFHMTNNKGELLMTTYHYDSFQNAPRLELGKFELRCEIPDGTLNEGVYQLYLIAGIRNQGNVFSMRDKIADIEFSVELPDDRSSYWLAKRGGVLAPKIYWEM